MCKQDIKKPTLVVSAFPASGKTYVYNNQKNLELTCLDIDSCDFSWLKGRKGINTKLRNPDFPKNYIDYIKHNLGTVDIIFVSSHQNVVTALATEGIQYVSIVPCKELLNEWVGRLYTRGTESLIPTVIDNWDSFTDVPKTCTLLEEIQLGSNMYIVDVLPKLLTYL